MGVSIIPAIWIASLCMSAVLIWTWALSHKDTAGTVIDMTVAGQWTKTDWNNPLTATVSLIFKNICNRRAYSTMYTVSSFIWTLRNIPHILYRLYFICLHHLERRVKWVHGQKAKPHNKQVKGQEHAVLQGYRGWNACYGACGLPVRWKRTMEKNASKHNILCCEILYQL